MQKFQDLEVKADTLVATLDVKNEAFIAAAMQLSGTIHADTDFLADQESIEKIRDDIVDHVIKFQEVLESKELLPPVPIRDTTFSASDPALIAILEKLEASLEKQSAEQTAVSEDLAKGYFTNS